MKKTIIFISFISLLFFSCSQNSPSRYSYHPPQKIDDGINVGTLEEAGINTALIEKAVDRISGGKYKEVHSILVYKDGMLVLEEYFRGHDYQWGAPEHIGEMVDWDRDRLHYVHSVSKSISSLLIGIAIDKGFIDNVHQSVFDYLPDYKYLETEENRHITIEHLLTMTSGLQWAEWNAPLSSIENDQVAIWFHKEGPVDFVLRRPMVAVPGTYFTYSGGNIEMLGVILENATGMTFQDFTHHYLFEPMGIDSAYWHIIYPTGEVHAAAGLRMTPREMLKIGIMMLNDGAWEGRQIVSQQWVKNSARPLNGNHDIKIPGEDLGRAGYSYTWWTKEIPLKGDTIHWFSANGWGGQKIVVLPELNTVVVLTGANYTSKDKEYRIFRNYIFPAIK